MSGLGSSFFSLRSARKQDKKQAEWTDLRDGWEYSHVVRAALAALSFIALAIALS